MTFNIGDRVRIVADVYRSESVPRGSVGYVTEVDGTGVSYPYRVDVAGNNWLYREDELIEEKSDD